MTPYDDILDNLDTMLLQFDQIKERGEEAFKAAGGDPNYAMAGPTQARVDAEKDLLEALWDKLELNGILIKQDREGFKSVYKASKRCQKSTY